MVHTHTPNLSTDMGLDTRMLRCEKKHINSMPLDSDGHVASYWDRYESDRSLVRGQ